MGEEKLGCNVIILRRSLKKGKNWKENEVWKKWGSGWGTERDRRKREKESGWERPSVAMETGSHQLTPCFSTRSPPTTNSLPFPSRSTRLSIASAPPLPHSFLFALSITTTPLSPFSLSLSVCHIPPLLPASLALYINHTLVFLHHLTLSSLTGFISTHSLFFFPLLLLFDFPLPSTFPLFTAAQIKPTTLCEILKRRDWKAEVQYKKKRQKKKIKPPPDARELWSQRKGDGREERGATKEETLSMKTEWLA